MLMPPNQPNPYDFIMNNNQPPKRGFTFGNTMGARIAVVAFLVILLIIIVFIANSFIGKNDKAQTVRLTEVAQAQSEIIRVSTLADKDAKTTATRNFAMNTRLSVQTSQQEIRGPLSKHGVNSKSLNKQLTASKNSKTDTALVEASKNNRYDETFTTIMNKQLADYQTLLKAAHDNGTASEKKVLQAAFDNVRVLIAKK
jgi:hypothetical protein